MRVSVVNDMVAIDIELPCSDAEMSYRMRKNGVTDVSPTVRVLKVMDGNTILNSLKGQTVNMDEVNFFVKRMESLTVYEQDVMTAYVSESGIGEIKDLINLTYSLNGLTLITDFSDTTKVGRRLYLDEFMGISAEEEEKINFVEFADKALKESNLKVLPYGVMVEHGFSMQEVYNGKTFPEYIHEPDKVVATLELQNRFGDTEFLYLPTDICAVDKMKTRLRTTSLSDCKVVAVRSEKLTAKMMTPPEFLNIPQKLSFFNELCQTVCDFDEEKMKLLETAAEFIGTGACTDYTYIAKHLYEIEMNPNVHNDEEYGRYLIEESGLFDVDELILPHINFASFALEKREGTMAESAYTADGFIGIEKERGQYRQYRGEYAEPLEMNAGDYETFCLYSPLTGQLIDREGNEGYLFRSDLTPYENKIADAIEESACVEEMARGLMHYFSGSSAVAGNVISARPKVAEIEGELYGVLECKVLEVPSEEEIKELKEYWTGQMSDGWGEGFEQQEISVSDGELYVSFWNSENFWSVMTEEELYGNQVQGMEMSV